MVSSKKDDNVFRYLKWRGDLKMEQDSFNDIDSFIVSQLTFLELMIDLTKEPVPLKEALKPYSKQKIEKEINLGVMIPKDCLTLGKTLIKCPRYQNLIISDFVKSYNAQRVEQFCALTLHLNEEVMVLAYQGTDDTLIGWEENFDMIKKFPVPAQNSSLNYLQMISEKYPNKKIYLTGHSKGGNLALYSGIFTTDEIKKRIIKVYNLDGPGFELNRIKEENLENIVDKIVNIYPQNSTVGMIFEHYGKTKIVKSNERGLLQHNGFSWLIDSNKFVKSTLLKNSQKFHDDLNNLVLSMNEIERERMTNSFYQFVKTVDLNTLVEAKNVPFRLLKAYSKFRKEDKKFLNKFVRLFIINKML